ncbi:MAG: benzoate/H(+) symporter BenE family transporter, partial [Solimonas sp.]
TALCLGIGVGGALLCWRLKMPVVLAWSTPGAALLASGHFEGGYAAALGAFVLSALLMMSLGLVPALGRLAARIPASIASAMLAGVLLPFCLALFRGVQHEAWLALPALGVFVLARQRWPGYALLLTLAVVVTLVLLQSAAAPLPPHAPFGTLSPMLPSLEPRTLLGLGLPLFLVTLASQNLPGLAVLRAAGYEPPPRPLLLGTGFASLLLAPFGAHSVNLAAITAAICTGDDTHPDLAQRWRVGLVYGGFYLALALFSAPLVALFLALPSAAIATIAGLALLAPLAGALSSALAVEREREAAVLTFVATASGLTLFGIGAAFWGLLTGFVVLAARRLLAR